MTIFLLSLGFTARQLHRKWYVFNAAVNASYYWLAVISVLTSVVSVFFIPHRRHDV